jgi:Na+/H+-dicarboxylate symporter
MASPLAPIGNAFINLLTMSVLPYVTLALIYGIGSLSLTEGKALLKKGGGFLLLIWAITFTTLFVLTFIFPSQHTPSFYSSSQPSHPSSNFLDLFFPSNPFYALANNIVPGVVVFSVLLGVALMRVSNKRELLNMLDSGIKGLTLLTNWIVRLSPIGIFALISSSVGTMSMNEFEEVASYLLAFIVGTIFLTFVAMPLLLSTFTHLTYRTLLKELQEPLVLSFATGNIFVSLPYLMQSLDSLTRHTLPQEKPAGERSTVQMVVPIAYNLPLVGNLMTMLFILFLSHFYAYSFSLMDNIRLSILSLFTLAGPVMAGLNSVAFLLDALRLPMDGLSLYVETTAITRNLTGIAGTMGIATFALLVHFAISGHLKCKLWPCLRNTTISVIIFAVLVTAAHITIAQQPAKAPPFPTFTIDIANVQSTVYTERIAPLTKHIPLPPESSLQRILRTGVLRVGYNPNIMPFCYFNTQQELVGYDIAFAYRLAASMGCRLEFIPVNYGSLLKDTEDFQLDIIMSGVSVTNQRLLALNFTEPYMTVDVAFLVPSHLRDNFTNFAQIQKMQGLKIGVLEGSHLEEFARNEFPNATIVPLSSYDEADVTDKAEVLLWTSQEGRTWTLLHPSYAVVTPQPPTHRDYYAWALPIGSEEFLEYVNYWLSLQKLRNVTTDEYDKWILGQTPQTTKRWSIIRNVLHWVD